MNNEALVKPLSQTQATVLGGAPKVIFAVVFFLGKTSIVEIKLPEAETHARIDTVYPLSAENTFPI
jgi:hypothetical protein